MLTTDTNMELRINRFSKFDSHLHQFANTSLIPFCERIVLEDLGAVSYTHLDVYKRQREYLGIAAITFTDI